ncbi:hypothetical protein [Millisia brevis]|uniref:hypothetical protein n=1 Tax=Millisia brevis TaxID=264148 RepID=UPI0012ED7688|nr:hypothetical protein [Millisia brevis]
MAAAVAAACLAGCSASTPADTVGGSVPDATSAASTAAPSTPLEVCSAILDDRDAATFTAGRDAATDVVLATIGSDTPPTSADRAEWHARLISARTELSVERDRLEQADTGQPAWAAIIAGFDATIDVLAARAAAVEAPGDPMPDALGIGEPYGFDAAPGELDPSYAGRDCEMLLSYPGPDAAARDFQVAAARTCTAIVERRASTDYAANVAQNLEIVAGLIGGETPEPTAAHLDAVRGLHDEWEQTLADLESVPTAHVPDAAAWEATLALPRQRTEMFADRAAALESGDAAAIEAAYDRERMRSTPGWEGWETVGLAGRDCRSIEA